MSKNTFGLAKRVVDFVNEREVTNAALGAPNARAPTAKEVNATDLSIIGESFCGSGKIQFLQIFVIHFYQKLFSNFSC